MLKASCLALGIVSGIVVAAAAFTSQAAAQAPPVRSGIACRRAGASSLACR
mgnify:CR=1 FL=1